MVFDLVFASERDSLHPGDVTGIPNPHSAVAMKSLSPSYEHDLELDEYSSSFYSEFLDDDRYPKVNYGGSGSTMTPAIPSTTTTTMSTTTTTINSYGTSYDTTPSHPSYGHGGTTNNNNNNNNSDQVTPTPPMDCNVTAFNKSLNTLTNLDENWQGEHPSMWNHAHVTQWLLRICERHQLDYERLRSGYGDYEWDSLTGCSLLALLGNSRHDMVNRFPYGGAYIYEALQELLLTSGHMDNENSLYPYDTSYNWTEVNGYDVNGVIGVGRNATINSHDHLHSNQLYGSAYPIKNELDSDVDSNQSLSYTTTTSSSYPCRTDVTSLPNGDGNKLLRRKPGRPPNKEKKIKSKNGQRNSRLWEFIRDLLLDAKTCPSLLKWENIDEGIFRFVQSDRVARLWGERKCNPRMTYEKLSRAMRYYYKSQVFLPVIGRRLVYRFGPNATGWRPNAHIIALNRA